MMGPSKILTVSYGTFSCTLEGFDDPFSTMRGIAEYFRDLAADDRYFGAEPPTPDAEMLHRIAQREVQNRVEAQVGDNGVVLRQLDGKAPIAEQAPAPAQPDNNTPAPVLQTAAPIAAAAAAATLDASFEPSDDHSELIEPADVPPLNDINPIETESVAAKLARIRSVVSADSETDHEALDDTMSEQMFEGASISSAFTETEEEFEENTMADMPMVDTTDADSDEITDTAEVEVEVEQDDEFEAEASETAEDVDAEDVNLDEINVSLAHDEAQDDIDTPEDDGADSISRIMGEVSESEPEDMDAQSDPDQPAIARVVKMRREDFEAALQAGDLEEMSEEAFEGPVEGNVAPEAEVEANADIEPEQSSSLSADDEAELMANLEQVQRKAEADIRSEKEGRALLENQDIEEDPEAVSRLLDVTNTEMEETEGTRRRSAIAHLKAAVAATRADKIFARKREEEDENELNQYRDDLAKAVRPNRPTADGRTKTRRIAPLVLVTEQRVDEASEADDTTQREAVMPRRIKSSSLSLSSDEETELDNTGDNIFVSGQTFAEFVQEMDAQELPDLLEAAAAYSAYVEGQDYFSRPQIMKAVSALDEGRDISREDNLRAFGTLLRRGKIKKLKRGQFVVASTTRFNPEMRAAGE